MSSPERQLEETLVEKLRGLKYEYREDIRDRAPMENNFREKFQALNAVKLTDAEFQRLLDEIVTPDVFTTAHTFRNRNSFTRALRPENDVNALFLAFLLLGNKPHLHKMVDIAGHGTGKLNTDELKALELRFPHPAEQQRIADCLSSLDARIAAESEKLAALKTRTTGIMQRLFPSPECA